MLKLSVIIVNYRGWEPLERCLYSLACLINASFNSEVIVVDNNSADGKLEPFSKQFPSVRFIENTGNFGFSNGNNLGARNSTGEYILFLNPDTVVSLPALNSMLEYLENHKESMVVSCQQENQSGKDENPFGIFPSFKSLTGISRAIFRILSPKKQLKTQCPDHPVIFPDWVSGSLIFMLREDFDNLGGWSEDFWMYYEDVDLCKRVSDKGGKIAFLCSTKIMHQHGGLTRKNPKQTAFFKTEVLKSKHIYVSKHFGGINACLMQTFLIINNLIVEGLLPALFGLILFFIPKMRVQLFIYFYLLAYYFNSIRHTSWLSGARSVHFQNS